MAKSVNDIAKRIAEVRQKIYIESRNTWRAQARRDYWKRVKRALEADYKSLSEGQLELFDECEKGNMGEIPQSDETNHSGLSPEGRLPNGPDQLPVFLQDEDFHGNESATRKSGG